MYVWMYVIYVYWTFVDQEEAFGMLSISEKEVRDIKITSMNIY